MLLINIHRIKTPFYSPDLKNYLNQTFQKYYQVSKAGREALEQLYLQLTAALRLLRFTRVLSWYHDRTAGASSVWPHTNFSNKIIRVCYITTSAQFFFPVFLHAEISPLKYLKVFMMTEELELRYTMSSAS